MLELVESVLHAIETWAVGLAASPWVFVVLFVFVVVDALFPPVPSETLVIAVAAYSVSTGGPPLWAVVATAAVGAVVGDCVAYLLGRRLNLRGWRLLRGRRVQAAFGWAENALAARPARFIVSARYVPVGRVAVNMTAGAIRIPAVRFVVLAAVGGLTWAVYSTVIGIGSGVWLGERPLVAMGVGVAGGLVVGYLVDWVVGKILGPTKPGPVVTCPDPALSVSSCEDSPRQDSPRQDSPRQDSPRQDSPRQDSPCQEVPDGGSAAQVALCRVSPAAAEATSAPAERPVRSSGA